MGTIHSLSWSRGSFSQGHLQWKKQWDEKLNALFSKTTRWLQLARRQSGENVAFTLNHYFNHLIKKIEKSKQNWPNLPCLSSLPSSCAGSCNRAQTLDDCPRQTFSMVFREVAVYVAYHIHLRSIRRRRDCLLHDKLLICILLILRQFLPIHDD